MAEGLDPAGRDNMLPSTEGIEVAPADEFDGLTGRALDDAVRDAGLELPKGSRADAKRAALREHAADS